jgi:hypothetical protein
MKSSPWVSLLVLAHTAPLFAQTVPAVAQPVVNPSAIPGVPRAPVVGATPVVASPTVVVAQPTPAMAPAVAQRPAVVPVATAPIATRVTPQSAPAPAVTAPITIDLSEPETVATTPSAPRGTASNTREISQRQITEESIQGLRIDRNGNHFAMNLFGNLGGSFGALHNHSDVGFGFSTAMAGLLFSARLGDKVFALTELVFENTDEGLATDLERVELRYRSGRHFVALGRTHTELGYWNTAFHHGAWLQPTIDRPRVIRFEDFGGLIPAHSVGAVAGTGIGLESGGSINLLVGVANGRGNAPAELQLVEDNNLWKAINARIDVQGVGPAGLSFGISGLYDRIAPVAMDARPNMPNTEIQEVIVGAHLVYRDANATFVSEAHVINHVANGRGWTSVGAFAVGSYRIGDFSPYMLVDALAMDRSDPYFFPGSGGNPYAPNSVKIAPGLRLDVTRWSSIRLEYHAQVPLTPGPVLHSGYLDWSFGI